DRLLGQRCLHSWKRYLWCAVVMITASARHQGAEHAHLCAQKYGASPPCTKWSDLAYVLFCLRREGELELTSLWSCYFFFVRLPRLLFTSNPASLRRPINCC